MKRNSKEENTLGRGRRYEEPKLNMKKVFAVIVAIIVVIMCVVMLKGLLGKSEENKAVSSIDYFPAYQNNKWGVIDSARKHSNRSFICRNDSNTK